MLRRYPVGKFLLLLLLLGLLFLLVRGIRRGTELFALTITNGSPKLVRGRCPARLLDEVGDVARLEKLDEVTVSVMSSGGEARVTADGRITDGQLQQLRNVVGRFQVAQIRQGNRRA